MQFAVDTGGTFTDLIVALDDGSVRIYKTPTSVEDPALSVLRSFALAAEDLDRTLGELLAEGERLVYGTTTATNAVVTGSTAKTALLTTAGHRDLLVLREGGRMGAALFDYSVPYPAPYVPRSLTFEVKERIGSAGEVLVPLDERALEEILDELDLLGVEAVGVCLLWSTANGSHERRVGELIRHALPHVQVTLSHVLNPTIREYRRASSACIDASLKPVMSRYLDQLSNRLLEAGFLGRLLVATSQGTVRDAGELSAEPIHTIKSGPAMAPVAGRYFAGTDADRATAIVTDTGGTTYDVSLIQRGEIPETRETWLGQPFLGHMTGFPSIDVRSVGAGGGSIASVDDGGLLSVGPESAGALPGPACFGHGGRRPTLTDACLVLGMLSAEHFLQGHMTLSVAAAEHAIETQVGRAVGLDTRSAAAAIVTVATETMALAVEEITLNRGIDPSTAVLVGGGGAAGLNAVAIARRIGCPKVLIPSVGATLSAAGALLSELGDDFAELTVTTRRGFDSAGVNATLDRLSARCRAFAERMGVAAVQAKAVFSVEARYAHQVWEIKVPLPDKRFTDRAAVERLCNAFHRLHRELFAVDDPQADIEFLTWRARVTCRATAATAPLVRLAARAGARAPRTVCFPGFGALETAILAVDDVPVGANIEGPAIVDSPFTTVVLDPGSTAQRSRTGGLLIGVRDQ